MCSYDSGTIMSGIDPIDPIDPGCRRCSEWIGDPGPILWADPGLRTAESTQKIDPVNDLHQEGRSAPGSIGSIGPILEPYRARDALRRGAGAEAPAPWRSEGVHELMAVAVL